MEEPFRHDVDGAGLKSWLVVIAIALGFLLWGVSIFLLVGDKGMPDWNFGVIEDVPGKSPYSTHSPKEYPSLAPLPDQGIRRQHVMGPGDETTEQSKKPAQKSDEADSKTT